MDAHYTKIVRLPPGVIGVMIVTSKTRPSVTSCNAFAAVKARAMESDLVHSHSKP